MPVMTRAQPVTPPTAATGPPATTTLSLPGRSYHHTLCLVQLLYLYLSFLSHSVSFSLSLSLCLSFHQMRVQGGVAPQFKGGQNAKKVFLRASRMSVECIHIKIPKYSPVHLLVQGVH